MAKFGNLVGFNKKGHFLVVPQCSNWALFKDFNYIACFSEIPYLGKFWSHGLLSITLLLYLKSCSHPYVDNTLFMCPYQDIYQYQSKSGFFDIGFFCLSFFFCRLGCEINWTKNPISTDIDKYLDKGTYSVLSTYG